jgi:hypothetical protein
MQSKDCQNEYKLDKLREECAAKALARRKERDRDTKREKYHTNSNYRQKKIDYQSKYDNDNKDSVRHQQNSRKWAVYQTIPEVKERKLNYQKQRYQTKKARKEEEERAYFQEKKIWQILKML